MREQTKDELKFWAVVVAIVVVFATTVYLLTILTAEQKAEAGGYLLTPSEHTQIYKFVEDDGTKCYIAESDGGAVAMQCEIAP